MIFSYDGTNFAGYQKQTNKRTVQEEIEKALFKILEEKTNIVASGRTDVGVHAVEQNAHFDVNKKIKPEKLRMAINSLTDEDIYIKNIKEVSPEFHARFDVVKKEYQYVLNMDDFNVFERNHVYQHCKKLDINKMTEGAKHFIGKHNFVSFCKKDKNNNDYVRIIESVNIVQRDEKLYINFIGSGFLRYMVRNMVGLLIEIGSGKREPDEVEKILNNQDRRTSGVKAPGEGLYLKKVYYNDK